MGFPKTFSATGGRSSQWVNENEVTLGKFQPNEWPSCRQVVTTWNLRKGQRPRILTGGTWSDPQLTRIWMSRSKWVGEPD